MFGNGMRLDADDLAALRLDLRSVARRLLVVLDRRLVDHRPRSDGDVVVLGKHPAVEVRRDVVSDIHLCQVLSSEDRKGEREGTGRRMPTL